MDLTRAYYLRTLLGGFLLLFPYSYFQDTLIPDMNETIDGRDFTVDINTQQKYETYLSVRESHLGQNDIKNRHGFGYEKMKQTNN